MESNKTGTRSLALLVIMGLALTVGFVTATAEPAAAIYVHWEADVMTGDVEVLVCSGSGSNPGVCV